jgi:hypothetical protein
VDNSHLLEWLGCVAQRHVGAFTMTVTGVVIKNKPLYHSLVVMQVLGLSGAGRKRTLLLWQAIEFARTLDRPNLHTLQVCPNLGFA